MAELITWYDILGVTAGAASDTISYAYGQRTALLRQELFSGAPSPVLVAATRAREAVQAAWLVLGDADRRNRYDKEIGLHRERGRGLAQGSHRTGRTRTRRCAPPTACSTAMPGYAFTALAAWLAPLPTPPRRRLTVPDTRGLFFRSCQAVVTVAGLRLATVRLTAGAVAGRGARRRPVAGAGRAGPAPEHADRAGMAPAAPPHRGVSEDELT